MLKESWLSRWTCYRYSWSLSNHNSKLAGPSKSALRWTRWYSKITRTLYLKRNSKDTKVNGISSRVMQARTSLCDFDRIFELQSLSKTAFIVNQVRKLQSQYLRSNTSDGTLLPAIPGSTRPKVGGAYDFFFAQVISFFVTVGFVYSWWRSTVTDGGVHRYISHVVFLLHSVHA